MSRLVYSDTPSTADQETLRATHGLRLVTPAEEGIGLHGLPGGVYGFTYSPGLPNAPLFAQRRYRSFETHKRADGEVFVVGFASADAAATVAAGAEDVTLQVQPQPEDGIATLIAIPYSRIRHHRQYAAPNQHGFTVTVRAALLQV